jgi:drug/metabolite transporter (DMT)-like permease
VLAGAGTGALDPLGTAAALGAAALYASYVLAVGRVGGHLPPLTFVALVSSGAALAFAVSGAVTGTLHAMSAPAWGWALALVLGSTVIAMSAFIGGVARLGAGRASILATLEPPIACVLAFLVFGDRLSPPQLAGGALVLSAALVLQMRPLRSRRRGAPALPTDRTAARALAPGAADGRRVGVRAEVGRLSRDRVRRRRRGRDPVARR